MKWGDASTILADQTPAGLFDDLSGFKIEGYRYDKKPFWAKLKKGVDEEAGAPGFFDDLMDSVKFDPNGPMVNIPLAFHDIMGNRVWHLSKDQTHTWAWSIEIGQIDMATSLLAKLLNNDPDAKLMPGSIWKIAAEEQSQPAFVAIARAHLIYTGDLATLRKIAENGKGPREIDRSK